MRNVCGVPSFSMYGHVYCGSDRLFFDRRDGLLGFAELACEPSMINPKCRVCRGLGWVCENHPERPWLDEVDGCQCSAGMRCECQDNDEEEPVILEITVRYH